ncbi:TonB family C-terminal domain-containing protein [Catalinimonas alkaloidigena]|uniref:TonB family C-terminal domain-containing protein n=1 Tax=Catalinimonas alkaloidigena TaxID=1075417 RepID=A0A1G8WBM4_9BACT|nr:energy transducer TonB [Catalinimonas alkaloidigena]SDJ75566.1 TonB family C-terminal domain-containing protein [Catalinimonas alkaloidigena]
MASLQSNLLTHFFLIRLPRATRHPLTLSFGLLLPVAVLLPEPLLAQNLTLVENAYEKGYLQNDEKYGTWEYYDERGELELEFDHSSGEVVFAQEDPEPYVVAQGGEWVEQSLDVAPRYLGSTDLWYHNIAKTIRYPESAQAKSIKGTVYVSFEVDAEGNPHHYKVEQDIGGGCGEEVIRTLQEVTGPWVPAQLHDQPCTARFIMPVNFSVGKAAKLKPAKDPLPAARMLPEFSIVAYGSRR